jgi:hypothetical protein
MQTYREKDGQLVSLMVSPGQYRTLVAAATSWGMSVEALLYTLIVKLSPKIRAAQSLADVDPPYVAGPNNPAPECPGQLPLPGV